MSSKYTKENLEKIVKNNISIKNCLIELSNSPDGNNYTWFIKQIKKYNIDISHFLTAKEQREIRRIERGGSFRNQTPFDEIFCLDSKRNISNNSKKEILYSKNIKQPVCELCGQNDIWNGIKISLILDHIDGMYSVCYLGDAIVHISANAEIEEVE
jgi:hypothetical protein